MSLGNLMALAALAVPVLGLGYQYTYVHLPAFRLAEQETYYARCLRECQGFCTAWCKANEIVDCECDCSDCLKHLEDD